MKKTAPTSPRDIRHKQRAAFAQTMEQAHTHMTPSGRRFSRIIHLSALERISDVIGTTIARPIPLICGSLAVIVMAGGMYATAKYYGYSLSGSEPLIAFLLGWLAGLCGDYIRLLIRGRRSHHHNR